MKVISELPKDYIFVWAFHDRYYYNPLGMKASDNNTFVNNSRENFPYFVEEENGNLGIYRVVKDINEANQTITFSKELIHLISYNEEFNEFDGNYEDIKDLNLFSSSAYNEEVLNQYLMKMMAKQDFCEAFINKLNFGYERLRRNNIAILKMFLTNWHKYVGLLLENDQEKYVEKVITGNVRFASEHYMTKITKRVILLANELNIEIDLATRLLDKFDANLLRKFSRVLTFVNGNNCCHQTIFDIIDNMNIINFSDFCNYFVKSFVSLNNISMNIIGDKNFSRVIMNFFTTYRDYLFLAEENDDHYPANLKMAHDAILERHNLKSDNANVVKYIPAFVMATKSYKNLEFEKDELKVIVPNSPNDLINESNVLHHCVKSYIAAVAESRTKICLVRKNDEPYMTVEIKENSIIQAKKVYNNLPDEEDEKFLQIWSKEKNLKISGY